MEKSYTKPTVTATFLDVVYDFKGWLSEVMRPMSNHTTPHAFKFKKDGHGNVIMFFKRFAMDSEWIIGGSILSDLPHEAPAIVRKTWEKVDSIEDLQKKFKTCENIMTNEDIKEWERYLNDLSKEQG